jgi:hypothetical protein
LDSTALLQLVGTVALLLLAVPGLIYALRERRRTKRVVAIGTGLIAASVLLFWLMVRQ